MCFLNFHVLFNLTVKNSKCLILTHFPQMIDINESYAWKHYNLKISAFISKVEVQLLFVVLVKPDRNFGLESILRLDVYNKI